MDLTDAELPALFKAADHTSLAGQRQYVTATSARLYAAVFASAASVVADRLVVGRVEVFGLVAAAAFVVALGLEVWLLADRPERDWYDGRALAESTKTLAWRFAVGGEPYPAGDRDAVVAFREALAGLQVDVPDVVVIPRGVEVVTAGMSSMREAPFEERRQSYVEHRVLDQQRWYAQKAEYNIRQARTWRLLLIALELAGVIVALVKALGDLHVDLASVTSAVIGAGAAWLGIKQHESLARSYTLASHELGVISERLSAIEDEKAWAQEVADAEEAISREHTMWRAARMVRGPTVAAAPARKRTGRS